MARGLWILIPALVVACQPGAGDGGGDAQPMTPGDTLRGDALPGDASGGDDPGGDAALWPYLPADQYCEAIADALCDFYLRCQRMLVADHAACVARTLESCGGRWEPRYVQLEAAGLVHLSRAGVDRCTAHLAEVPCADQFQELRGPCGGMWEGTQAAGEPCSILFGGVESYVCAPGTTCSLSLTLCGTCETALAEGAPCPATGATCSPAGTCVGGLCVRRALMGESCAPTDECELGASCTGGVCQALTSFVGLGDPCGGRVRCPYGSTCLGGTCQDTAWLGESCTTAPCETGTCALEICTALTATGDPCLADAECATGVCDPGGCASLPSACF